MTQAISAEKLRINTLFALLHELQVEPTEPTPTALSFEPEQLMEMLVRASGNGGGGGGFDYIPDQDPYRLLIGKHIFFRGGIFAYLCFLEDVTQEALICRNVCWLADAGDLNKLLGGTVGKNVKELGDSIKLQYYLPDQMVIMSKMLISDVTEFFGNYNILTTK